MCALAATSGSAGATNGYPCYGAAPASQPGWAFGAWKPSYSLALGAKATISYRAGDFCIGSTGDDYFGEYIRFGENTTTSDPYLVGKDRVAVGYRDHIGDVPGPRH